VRFASDADCWPVRRRQRHCLSARAPKADLQVLRQVVSVSRVHVENVLRRVLLPAATTPVERQPLRWYHAVSAFDAQPENICA
jgi:hypothetical protein